MTHVATHRQAMVKEIGSAIEGSARGARALGLITA